MGGNTEAVGRPPSSFSSNALLLPLLLLPSFLPPSFLCPLLLPYTTYRKALNPLRRQQGDERMRGLLKMEVDPAERRSDQREVRRRETKERQ